MPKNRPPQFDAYTGEPIQPVTVPTSTPLPDSGYTATVPGVIGAGHEIYYLVTDGDRGCAMVHRGRKPDGDDTPNIHVIAMRQMYARLKRERVPLRAAGAATKTEEPNE
jgi:hypothetical protein